MIILKKKNLGLLIGFALSLIIGILLEILLAYFFGKLINSAAASDYKNLFKYMIFGLILVLIFPFINYLYHLLKTSFINTLILNLKEKLFDSMIKDSYQDFYKQDTGSKLSIFHNDLATIEKDYYIGLIDMVKASILLVISFIYIFVLSKEMAFTYILLSGISFVIPKLIGKNLDQLKQEMIDEQGEYTSSLTEYFKGYDVIATYQLEDRIEGFHKDKLNQVYQASMKFYRSFLKIQGTTVFLGGFTFMGGLLIGSYLVATKVLLVGTLITCIHLSNNINQPIYTIAQNMMAIHSVKKVKEKLSQILKAKNVMTVDIPLDQGVMVELEDANIFIDDKLILREINLTLEAGKKYLLIGSSGSGKSTLLKVISGQLKVDQGLSIKKNLKVATISQNTFLFSGSLMENLTLYDDSITFETAKEAMSFVGLDKFISHLEEKDFIKENGQNLSGGERQRIAIARAILKDSSIIVSDESTASLDYQHSLQVEKNLLALDKTIIFSTHKLSQETLYEYDQVILLGNQSVIAKGSVQELEKSSKEFREIMDMAGMRA